MRPARGRLHLLALGSLRRWYAPKRQIAVPANVPSCSVPAGKHGRGGLVVSEEFDPKAIDDPFEMLTTVDSWIPVNAMADLVSLCRYGDRYWGWSDWSGFVEFGRHESEANALAKWRSHFSVPSFNGVDWIDGDDIGENEPPDGFEWVEEDYGFRRVDAD